MRSIYLLNLNLWATEQDPIAKEGWAVFLPTIKASDTVGKKDCPPYILYFHQFWK